jgi:uncharacterized protein (DUF1499 family)
MVANKIWEALTQNTAQTSEEADDPRLRGRTYVIPFARVWDEIIEMIESAPRWTLVSADEGTGLIHAEARTLVFRFVDDIRFKLKLDQNALTRVDMWSASRVGRGDLGTNARRIRRFFRHLDRRLEVSR